MRHGAWGDCWSRAFDNLWAEFKEYEKDPAAYDAKMAKTHDRIPWAGGGFFWWRKDDA